MIPAFGDTAFHPSLTPFMLYSAAAQAGDDEDRETFESFARDFAAIQGLPELVKT